MYENGGCLDGGIPEEVFYEFHNRFEIRKFNRKINQIYILIAPMMILRWNYVSEELTL